MAGSNQEVGGPVQKWKTEITFVTSGDGGVGDGGVVSDAKPGEAVEDLQGLAIGALLAELAHQLRQP